MKFPLRYLLSLVVLPVPEACAIQDGNSNGLSDVWERHYNNADLFSPADPDHLPPSDPDADGWTNAEEAIAGTDPFRAAPPHNGVPAALSAHAETAGAYVINWPSAVGKNYRLLRSGGLEGWTAVGAVVPGTGSTIQITLDPAAGDPSTRFWRVEIEDADPDGDTLTSWEELKLGLNPVHADSDLDGIPDNLDPFPLANGVTADPDGSGLPATLADGLIGRWDCEQLTSFTATVHGFADQAGNDHPLVCGQTSLSLDPLGMISKGVVLNEVRDYLVAPPSLLHGRASFSVSLWFKLVPNSIRLHNGHTALLAINEALDPAPELLVTVFRGVVGSPSQKIFVNGYAGGILTSYLIGEIPQADWIDDGKWHHLALTKQSNQARIYLDGVQEAQGFVPGASFSMTSGGYLCFGKAIPNAVSAGTNVFGSMDRIRCYGRSLAGTEVAALASQDSDRDGRTDLSEVRTRTWTDGNGNGSVEPGEVSYAFSPFIWEPPSGN